MDEQTMTMPGAGARRPDRIVEFELRRPHREDLGLTRAGIESARQAIEDAALTGIGLAIITGRSLAHTLEAAHKAGKEAAANPGPMTRMILRAVGHREPIARPLSRRSVPVLPIADYASLDSAQVIERLSSLDRAQLESVRAYELEHEGRPDVLRAIDNLLQSAN